VKIIKGDLVLKKDTIFKESIKVEGNIRCEKERWNLTVAWDIDAENIDARNIDAENIVARNIDARNIDAENIDAWNIDAENIDTWNIVFCEKVKVKLKIIAKAVIRNRSKLERKEFESDK
jgi:hypothetical protein